jgi:hypothetical protein
MFPDYLVAQKSNRFDKFWATMNHQWFTKFPEVVNLPAREPGLPALTAEEEKPILDELKANAIKKRKKVSLFFFFQQISRYDLPAFIATEDLDALAS